jgi:hypothetical protein
MEQVTEKNTKAEILKAIENASKVHTIVAKAEKESN